MNIFTILIQNEVIVVISLFSENFDDEEAKSVFEYYNVHY